MALILRMAIAVNGLSHPLMPTRYHVNDKRDCIKMCFYDESCNSVFFDTVMKTCYPSKELYTQADLTSSSADMLYFVWQPEECDGDYTYLRDLNLCYKLVTQPTNWYNARSTCASNGGHQIKVETLSLNEFLLDLAKQNGKALWLGIRAEANIFLWEDGSSTDAGFWNNLEPCNTCGGCAAIDNVASIVSNSWFDNGCGNELIFVCQKDVRVITATC